MLFMFFFILTIDPYVIDEHNDEFVQKFHKDLVYPIHKVGRGSGQLKRPQRMLI
jgi:hypothetical protein